MSVSEQCLLEMAMLEHFNLLPVDVEDTSSVNGSRHPRKVKRLPKKGADALKISQSFFSLAETTDAPVDCEEMILAIRYRMGYGWLAWFLFKNFAIPIIKWLWKRYHNPDPVGSPTT